MLDGVRDKILKADFVLCEIGDIISLVYAVLSGIHLGHRIKW